MTKTAVLALTLGAFLPLKADTAPSPPAALPQTTTIILVRKTSAKKPPKPELIFGDASALNINWLKARETGDSVYIVARDGVQWDNLLNHTTSQPGETYSVHLPITAFPSMPSPSLAHSISTLVSCWMSEKDRDSLVSHTEIIAFHAIPALREKYAAEIFSRTINDPFRGTCAACIVSRSHPTQALRVYFKALITPPAGTELEKNMIQFFRDSTFQALGLATDASNFETHWALMLKVPEPARSPLLDFLLSDPFYRRQNPLDLQKHLAPHRAELLAMARSTDMRLSYQGYLGVRMLNNATGNAYHSLEAFVKYRDKALKSLEP